MIEPDKLEVFEAIWRHRNITHAAAELHRTQSAISQSLSKLEQNIGHPLFSRVSDGLKPTCYGEELHATAAPFLRSLKQLHEQWALDKAQPQGLVRLGLPLLFGTQTLMPALSSLLEAHPGIRLELHFGIPEPMQKRVALGQLCAAICDENETIQPSQLRRHGLTARVLAQEEHCVVGIPKVLNHQDRMPPKALKTLPWIAYTQDCPAIKKFLRKAYKKRLSLKPKIVVNDLRGVLAAVRLGWGVGVLPIDAIRKDIKAGRLVCMQTQNPVINRMLLITSDRVHPSIAAQAVIAEIIDRCSSAPV